MRELDCGAFAKSVRGGKKITQRERRDLYSFGPRETSSGKNPTCCLWLGLIPSAHRESPACCRLSYNCFLVASDLDDLGVISNLELPKSVESLASTLFGAP